MHAAVLTYARGASVLESAARAMRATILAAHRVRIAHVVGSDIFAALNTKREPRSQSRHATLLRRPIVELQLEVPMIAHVTLDHRLIGPPQVISAANSTARRAALLERRAI